MNTINTLSTKNIIKFYKSKKVLHGIDITMSKGQVVGFLGPNGSGKTTLFYIIAGLIPPSKGQIFLDDLDITILPMHLRSRMGLGYLPQEASIFKTMSVKNNILSILELHITNKAEQQARLEELLDVFKIGHLFKQKGASLSGGERRRVEIARAMATDPKFLLLDEPFAGVDPIAVEDLKDIIKTLASRNVGILITDHNVKETLEIVDKSYILYDGKILASGSQKDIANDMTVKKVYLGSILDRPNH